VRDGAGWPTRTCGRGRTTAGRESRVHSYGNGTAGRLAVADGRSADADLYTNDEVLNGTAAEVSPWSYIVARDLRPAVPGTVRPPRARDTAICRDRARHRARMATYCTWVSK